MGNTYVDDETVSQNYYGGLAHFIIDALKENRGGALSADDVSFFVQVRARLEPDRARFLRVRDLDQAEALSPEQLAELESLASESSMSWEDFCNRTERCIANWCLSNPEFIDRKGRPIQEQGFGHLEQILTPPPSPPPCSMCNGRGFFQAETPTGFPKRCRCQAPGPV